MRRRGLGLGLGGVGRGGEGKVGRTGIGCVSVSVRGCGGGVTRRGGLAKQRGLALYADDLLEGVTH